MITHANSEYHRLAILNFVNKAVFFVNTTRPQSRKISLKGFWFTYSDFRVFL